MLVDVSHLSDRGFWDVCEATDRPFVATHSDSAGVCAATRATSPTSSSPRSRSAGGLVGVNLYTPFLVRQSDSVIDDAIDHIERFHRHVRREDRRARLRTLTAATLLVGIEGLGDMYRLADRMFDARIPGGNRRGCL